jgi:hypothetical protein
VYCDTKAKTGSEHITPHLVHQAEHALRTKALGTKEMKVNVRMRGVFFFSLGTNLYFRRIIEFTRDKLVTLMRYVI